MERAIAAVDLKALYEPQSRSLGSASTRTSWPRTTLNCERIVASTTPPVRRMVRARVRLVAELLDSRFGETLTFADEGVVLLDPAVGARYIPIDGDSRGSRPSPAALRRGCSPPGRAAGLAANTHAFETLIGPYAVAHLRLCSPAGDRRRRWALPPDGAHVYLTDTLRIALRLASWTDDPAPQTYLSDEHRRAQKVESGDALVLVCIGNPPYDRQVVEPGDLATDRKGGWVRFGDPQKNGRYFDEGFPGAGSGGRRRGPPQEPLQRLCLLLALGAVESPSIRPKGPALSATSPPRPTSVVPASVGMREWMRRTFR